MKKLLPLLAVASVGLVGVALGASPSAAQESSRYPYDPVCPWGRLSNGKGMLVRCIAQEEATGLAVAGPGRPTKPAPSASSAPSASPSASSEPQSAPEEDPAKLFTLKSVSVTADQGKLGIAEKKLAQAKDKMFECLAKHGGLEKNEGEVAVRFLVSARGRAEGVSVHKRVAVGSAAAECIAHVVDRRPVGSPEAPMVGATALFRFGKLKK